MIKFLCNVEVHTPQGGTTAGNAAGGAVWWIRARVNAFQPYLRYVKNTKSIIKVCF